MIYQIRGVYSEDDCADELTNVPALNVVWVKGRWCYNQHNPDSSNGWMMTLQQFY